MPNRWMVNICPFLHFDNSRIQTYEHNISIVSWNVKSVLDYLDVHESHKFCFDQVTLLEGFKRLFPNYWDQLHQRVLEGRIEIVGGTYVMPDFIIPDGESIARQFLLGCGTTRSDLGVDVRTGWAVDSAGHFSQLPQVLRLCGIDTYYFWRGMEYDAPTEFVWKGPDGSKVNAVWLMNGFDSAAWLSENTREAFSRLLSLVEDSGDSATSQNVFLPVGGELVPPLPHLNDVVERWNKTFPDMKIDIVTPGQFSEKLKGVQADLPAISGPLISGRFSGIRSGGLSARIGMKLANRQLEGLLYLCELYLCQSGDTTRAGDLENLWRILLFNQDHNIIRGTIADEPYLLAMKRFKQAIVQAEELLESAIAGLASKIKHDPEDLSFVVFNPLPWKRTDVVRIHVDISNLAHDFFDLQGPDGESVTYQMSSESNANPAEIIFIANDMPSLGHRVYRVVGTDKRPDFVSSMKVGSSWAETSEYILEFDEFNGAISRLYDKVNNVEVFSGHSNHLASESDVGDLYRFSAPEFVGDVSDATSLRTPGALKLLETGPIRTVFEVVSEFDGSPKTDRITIYEGIHRIDFEMNLDFQSRNRRVRLNFLLPIFERDVTVGSQFGAERRCAAPTEDTLNDQSSIFSALDWVDCAGPEFGVCLSAPGLHEFEFTDGVLRATILRSVDYLSHGLDDDVVETRTAREQGEHHYRYMLHSHAGDWDTADIWKVTSEHRLPLIAYHLEGTSGSFNAESPSISIEGVSLAISSVRSPTRENAIVIRLYEPSGKSGKSTLTFMREIERVELVDMLEREIGMPNASGKSVEVPVDSHSIITLRVNFKESSFSL